VSPNLIGWEPPVRKRCSLHTFTSRSRRYALRVCALPICSLVCSHVEVVVDVYRSRALGRAMLTVERVSDWIDGFRDVGGKMSRVSCISAVAGCRVGGRRRRKVRSRVRITLESVFITRIMSSIWSIASHDQRHTLIFRI
jgi:hypothetical protein